MTDNSNDAQRQHVDQLADTGSASTRGRHPDQDTAQADERDANGLPTESEKELTGSER